MDCPSIFSLHINLAPVRNRIKHTDRRNNDVVIINQKQNGGEGTITGVELAVNHTMDYLPGMFSGFGVQANYTRTESSQSSGINDLDGSELLVPNLSPNSYNLILFYDKYGFNFRAAYNYRDESYNGPASSSQDLLYFEPVDNPFFTQQVFNPYGSFIPVWNDEFATLDLAMSYKYGDAKVFVQATNVLNAVNRQYVGTRHTTKLLTKEYRDTGAAYTLGFSYNF